jgi:hypothetical protein
MVPTVLNPSSQRVFRLSLREVFVLVALVALAIPSLKYASELWLALVAAVSIISLFVALIVAVVDRGLRQAFAIGFALIMAGYGLIVISSPTREFDQWEGRLPTTQLLRYTYSAVDRSEWNPVVVPLQMGATGVQVEVLQRMLNARVTPSPNLQVDGDFGSLTNQAVKWFQRQAALNATGDVDTNTWKALGLVFDSTSLQPVVPAYANPNASDLGFSYGAGSSFHAVPPRENFMHIGHYWWALLLGYAGGHFARFVYWRRIGDARPLATESP